MNKLIVIGTIFGLFSASLVSSIGHAVIIDPDFAIDPASPSIDGNITPDDVLKTGPVVFTQGTDLDLVDDFFTGFFDSLNALSYGQDPVTRPPPGRDLPLYFSVDRVAIGLPGTAVNAEAQPGSEEAAGDVFVTNFPDVSGTNEQFIDEESLGLIPGFFGDDLDAVELDTEPSPWTYFSFDFLSATNGFGFNQLANDIFVEDASNPDPDSVPDPYAIGEIHIGLLPDDDLDALVLLDVDLDGVVDPGRDLALFSLSTFSPSTFTFTGNDYIPGVQEFLSSADILFTDFTGDFSLWASANDIGLFSDDEVDALDTIPEPGSFLLLGVGLFGFLAHRKQYVYKVYERVTKLARMM